MDEAVGSTVGDAATCGVEVDGIGLDGALPVEPDAERWGGSIVGPAACGTQASTHAPMVAIIKALLGERLIPAAS